MDGKESTAPVKVDCHIISHFSEQYHSGNDSTIVSALNRQLTPFKRETDKWKSDKFYYGVRIVTGSQSNAGTVDSTLFMELIGAEVTSGIIELANKGDGGLLGYLEHCFRSSTINDFVVEAANDLSIVVLKLGLKQSNFLLPGIKIKDTLYVEFMQCYNLQKVDEVTTFPCYQWIETEVSCTSQTSTVKNVQFNSELMKQRNHQLTERLNHYWWQSHPDTGYPSSIDDNNDHKMPINEEFERAKQQNFLGNIVKGGMFGGFAAIHTTLSQKFEEILGVAVLTDESVVTLEKFIKYAVKIRSINKESPTISSDIVVYEGYRWVSDVEFGRQMLNGVNPVVIQRCTSLPDNFPFTEDMAKGLVASTLSEEIKAGRIYICDLSEVMDGLKCRKGYYCPAPTCLLRVNDAGQLVPIAIQLKKEPGPENPIFLPTDNWMDWLLAKIYYQCAHSQFHQLSTHYIACHATMEAYGVAVMRTLPDAHPVYKLLHPHIRYTMSINTAARDHLIGKNGIIDNNFSIGGEGKVELVKRANNLYSVHGTHIKRNLKERGVDDPNLLPGYYYRDDGIQIWDAIEAYVQEIIDIFYSSDDDVKDDPELCNWVNEVHTKAFPAFRDALQGRGFPATIDTKIDLVDYCTLVIFTGSAQHAAVNFGQYDMYGYIPNAPVCVRQPPPIEKGKVAYSHLLNSLPSTFDALLSTAVTSTLAQYSPDEIFLGSYPQYWFTEPEARDAEKRFANALEDLELKFESRNKTLDLPYTYLLPKRIPNSITI